VIRKTKPKRAKNPRATETLAAENRALVNTWTSSIGCVLLRSHRMKAARTAAPKA
jgi:hypothetical protein